MAQTTDLLSLVDEFPIAFLDPEPQGVLSAGNSVVSPISSDPAGRTQQLLQLMEEFAPAFADPDSAPSSKESTVETRTNSDASLAATPVAPQATGPAGYTHALHRRLHTIAWGQIEVYLSYDDCRLQSIWIAVGKSGTEVQSLCEAIARLINLLLAQQIAIPAIVREIRGIRGADAEGFGPHRILGLADLIGKVLQEAPASLAVNKPAEIDARGARVSDLPQSKGQSTPTAIASTPIEVEVSTATPTQPEPTASADAYTWVSLPNESRATSLCPECGAQLQVMNGCSGGACNVCGYSSCS